MRRDDIIEAFQKIPETMHQYVNLVMINRAVLAVDVVARFEPRYLVMRGREGGTTDEGRAFFVPYDEISYMRVEQVVRLGELKRMYGETDFLDTEDKLGQQIEAEAAAKAEAEAKPALVDNQTPPPAAMPSDPASIAKQNLLDRIRAARANASGATGTLGGKKG
jgi:hypothetical protein